MHNSEFVKLVEGGRKNQVWKRYSENMKMWFTATLTLLKYMDDNPSIFFEEYYTSFDRLMNGYNGIGKGNGYVSGIVSEATLTLPKGVNTVSDHVCGALEVGRFVHIEFKKCNYDIDYMVNTWLYKHLFLWATIYITPEEHHKDNVVQNVHSINQKVNFEHYLKVSPLINYSEYKKTLKSKIKND